MSGQHQKKILQTWTQLGFKKYFVLAFLIIAINAPIVHLFTPSYDEQTVIIEQERKVLIKNIISRTTAIFSDFKSKKISDAVFIDKYEANQLANKIDKKAYYQKRKEIIKSVNYRGYTSLQQFLFSVGIAFFILLTQLRFMFKVIKSQSQTFEKIEVFLYTSMAMFIFSWTIVNTEGFQDFTQITYLKFMIVIDITIVAFIYLFLSHYKTLEKKLQNIIHIFSKLAVLDAPKFMSKKENKAWSKFYIKELENGIDK